jgi:hypothetical protein
MDKGFIRNLSEYYMAAITLEQIEVETVKVSCRSCQHELVLPVESFRKVEEARRNNDSSILGKSYAGVYVSPERALVGRLGIYCNKDCFSHSMED